MSQNSSLLFVDGRTAPFCSRSRSVTPGTPGTTGSGTAGEQSSGSAGGGSVLGATTSQSGSTAPSASVTPAQSASSGKPPFTGTDEWMIAGAGALMLLGGLALRRRIAGGTR